MDPTNDNELLPAIMPNLRSPNGIREAAGVLVTQRSSIVSPVRIRTLIVIPSARCRSDSSGCISRCWHRARWKTVSSETRSRTIRDVPSATTSWIRWRSVTKLGA